MKAESGGQSVVILKAMARGKNEGNVAKTPFLKFCNYV